MSLKSIILIANFVLFASAQMDVYDETSATKEIKNFFSSSKKVTIPQNMLTINYAVIAVAACMFGCGCGAFVLCLCFLICNEFIKNRDKLRDKKHRFKIVYVNPRCIMKSFRRGNFTREANKDNPVSETPLTARLSETHSNTNARYTADSSKPITPYASRQSDDSIENGLCLTYAEAVSSASLDPIP